jgi:uncharacterized protein
MDQHIITRFKQQDFSGGIRAGVVALDAMARELQRPGTPPSPVEGSQSYPAYQPNYQPSSSVYYNDPQPTSSWAPWATIIFVGLGIFTVVSLIRNGSSGWAWLFWGAVFSIIGYVLYQAATSRSHRGSTFGSSTFGGSSSGGGFSGGSFGGGFSGGGGSTGSW